MAIINIDPITIVMEGSLHIGAGHRRGLVDRAVMRDGRGQVYVPGSSLKGKAREACEWIASSQGLTTCRPPYPKGMCSAWKTPCIVCRIFGAPGGRYDEAVALYWDNAYLTEDLSRAAGQKKGKAAGGLRLSYARTQVGMSRRRGVAYEGFLFTSEFAAKGLTFQTQLSGHLPLTSVFGEPGRYYELILLIAGLKLVNSLGGNTSQGAGRCRLKLPNNIHVRSKEHGAEDLSQDWLVERLDLLELYKDEIEEANG